MKEALFLRHFSPGTEGEEGGEGGLRPFFGGKKYNFGFFFGKIIDLRW